MFTNLSLGKLLLKKAPLMEGLESAKPILFQVTLGIVEDKMKKKQKNRDKQLSKLLEEKILLSTSQLEKKWQGNFDSIMI